MITFKFQFVVFLLLCALLFSSVPSLEKVQKGTHAPFWPSTFTTNVQIYYNSEGKTQNSSIAFNYVNQYVRTDILGFLETGNGNEWNATTIKRYDLGKIFYILPVPSSDPRGAHSTRRHHQDPIIKGKVICEYELTHGQSMQRNPFPVGASDNSQATFKGITHKNQQKVDYWEIDIQGGGYKKNFTVDYYVNHQTHLPVQLNLRNPLPIAQHKFVDFSITSAPYVYFYPWPLQENLCHKRKGN